MVMEVVNESSGSKANDTSSLQSRQQRQKLDVYNEVLRRLRESDNDEANRPGFEDELWTHFKRLPTRYALDVNVERAEDVLIHKRLLYLAHDPANRPAMEVRLVQLLVLNGARSMNEVLKLTDCKMFYLVQSASDGADSTLSNPLCEESAQNSPKYSNRQSIHPPPAFGSSPNLEALALEANKSKDQDGDSSLLDSSHLSRPMHEVTFSTEDKPKLLSQLTALLAEVGLNIQEAHVFSTVDGYSLDCFVVDGWPYEETERLKFALEKEILKIEKQSWLKQHSFSPTRDYGEVGSSDDQNYVAIPNDGIDVWEIDPRQLKFETKVASGSYGDLYKGTYCSQEVAIKVLKPERINTDLQKEFAQEVFIMRKVRHKNVVQFIGACTKPPNLYIVTEFMSGGSVYDYLHKQKGVFKLPSLLKVAIDVSKGMNYLHQNNIIHRDLKAPNLLMDENEVVKVADFGVARVKAQSGVMTAETGTYRWMAPE
ncbi:hypothetical protein Goshw_027440, partial [Gossypium schwendimanii]|nr:hypothetical protein [Gossypium schwendimanii]